MTFEGHLGDLLIVVTMCAQLTRDLSATAKFVVNSTVHVASDASRPVRATSFLYHRDRRAM